MNLTFPSLSLAPTPFLVLFPCRHASLRRPLSNNSTTPPYFIHDHQHSTPSPSASYDKSPLPQIPQMTDPTSTTEVPTDSPTPFPTSAAPSSPAALPSQPFLPSTRATTRSQHGIFQLNPKYMLHATTTPSPIPKNLVHALNSPNWKLSMRDEYDALIENNTWDFVPRPPGVNVIHSMWIFLHKLHSDGSFELYKARLVGDGKTNRLALIAVKLLVLSSSLLLFALF